MQEKVSSCFKNGRQKIVSVTPGANYNLLLVFDNGENRIYDAMPVIMSPLVKTLILIF